LFGSIACIAFGLYVDQKTKTELIVNGRE